MFDSVTHWLVLHPLVREFIIAPAVVSIAAWSFKSWRSIYAFIVEGAVAVGAPVAIGAYVGYKGIAAANSFYKEQNAACKTQ